MRRIEFLAPVEAMRGNLSGNQNLLYPTQDNTAWLAPSDRRNYATNYGTRYIGAKRAATGKKFFAVKTKSAVNMSPKMRKNMAVLSVGSVAANIIMTDLSTLTTLQELFYNSPERLQGWTFKRWISVYTREGLANQRHIAFPAKGSGATVFYINPYITQAAPPQAHTLTDFPSDLLVKFWLELASGNPIIFKVGTLTGIAREGMQFSLISDPANPSPLNVLGLEIVGPASGAYIQINGSSWLKDPTGENYVSPLNTIIANARYQITDISPLT